jgi:hypothetical protein
MPRLVKQIHRMIRIPEKWTYDPVDENGKKQLERPVEYEIGGGEVKVFSLSEQDFAKIKDDVYQTSVSATGAVMNFSQKIATEIVFSARLGGKLGAWDGFYDEGGEPLNCTVKNQKEFAHFEGLRNFVCSHVGPILDKIANGRAEESEKNLLNSLLTNQESEKPQSEAELVTTVK